MYVLIRRVKLNIIINLLQTLAHTHTHTKSLLACVYVYVRIRALRGLSLTSLIIVK